MNLLREFVRESNRIESITRAPTKAEVSAHLALLALQSVSVDDMVRFVSVIAPRARLRDRVGLDVRVGGYYPPAGGPEIATALAEILVEANTAFPTQRTAWDVHHQYESLHPFTDGNGRSGRALWLWMMQQAGGLHTALEYGFLRSFYYQSLRAGRGKA